jgi:Ulp1 family protease
MQGNNDSRLAGKYCYDGVSTWTKKLLGGTPIHKMKMFVFFMNEGNIHWKCFGIFVDLKIIQAFDSMGDGCAEYLQGLYQWLEETMQLAGQSLDPIEWCLYTTRDDSPRQNNSYDCGLFTILIRVCIVKRLSYKLITKELAASARCLLLLHLVDLAKDTLNPLVHGPVGRQGCVLCTYQFHWDGDNECF